MIIIRYADDIGLGFQHEHEARACRHDLGARMRKFGLALHPKKTRLISFGRHAAKDRRRQGQCLESLLSCAGPAMRSYH